MNYVLRSFFLLYEMSFCLETHRIDFELLKEEGGQERASNMVNEPVNMAIQSNSSGLIS